MSTLQRPAITRPGRPPVVPVIAASLIMWSALGFGACFALVHG